ncbi:MAG: hypothetical protein ABII03_00500 [Nanoarchaeota archaeon]|nr:hypothetical protein [Nanoarchaeota archaeon]
MSKRFYVYKRVVLGFAMTVQIPLSLRDSHALGLGNFVRLQNCFHMLKKNNLTKV